MKQFINCGRPVRAKHDATLLKSLILNLKIILSTEKSVRELISPLKQVLIPPSLGHFWKA